MMLLALKGKICIPVEAAAGSGQNKSAGFGQNNSMTKEPSAAPYAPAVELPLPDARVLWGRALLAIKKANKIMLHSVCVNLGKFSLEGDTLRVHVPSQLDYEMLRKPQNCGDLVESLRNLGYNVNIEFVLDETAGAGREDKIVRLRRILGADITVIN